MATSKNPWEEDQVIATADGVENGAAEENGAEETAPETNYNDAVQELYIAYYGRPADPAGLAYWVGQAKAAGGVDAIVGGFTTSDESSEFVELGRGVADLIDFMFNNAYNRPAPAALRAEWVEQFDLEEVSVADITLAILAQEGAGDRNTLAAKLQAANTFTAAVAESGQEYTSGQIELARTELGNINTNTDQEELAEAYALLVAEFPSQVSGDVALTAGTDRVQGDNSDTNFTAIMGSDTTLDQTDQIGGGAGNNTLTVEMTSGFNGFRNEGYLRDVQTVTLNQDDRGQNFNAQGTFGVETFILRGEALGDLTSLEAIRANTSLHIDLDVVTQDVITFNFRDGVGAVGSENPIVGGTEVAPRTLEITLQGAGVREDLTQEIDEEVFNIDVENSTLNRMVVNTTGTNIIDLSDVVAADRNGLILAGEGYLKINGVNTDLRTVDATASTAEVDLDLTNVVAAGRLTSIQMGEGDSKVTLNQNALALNADLNGGGGTNTLAVDVDNSALLKVRSNNFQELELSELDNDLTVAAQDMQGLELVRFTHQALNDPAGGHKATVANVAANLTTEIVGEQNDGAEVVVDTQGTATLNVVAHDLAVATEGANGLAENEADFNASRADDLVINAGRYSQTSTDALIRASDADSLTLNVASGVDKDGQQLTYFAGEVRLASAETIDVNANGRLGENSLVANAAVITAHNAEEANITVGNILTGAVNGTTQIHHLQLNARSLEDLNITARGNLVISEDAAGNLRNVENLSINALRLVSFNQSDKGTDVGGASDTIALRSAKSVELSGNQIYSQVILGDLGRSWDTQTNATSLDITASGLNMGLTLGNLHSTLQNVTSSQHGDKITLDISEVRAGIDLDAVADRHADTNSNATQDAAVSVGNVTARDFEVDAAGMYSRNGIDIAQMIIERDIDLDFEGASVFTGSALKLGNAFSGQSAVDGADPVAAIRGGNYTLNAEGFTGDIEVDAITYRAALDNATVDFNFTNVIGEVEVGNIVVKRNILAKDDLDNDIIDDSLTGSIKLDLTGVTELATIGQLSAKTVTVEARGLLGGVADAANTADTWGDIFAETLNFTGTEVDENKLSATISKEATLNGGLEDDVFNVFVTEGNDGFEDRVTLKGNLGLGDNEVNVTIPNLASGAGDELEMAFNLNGQTSENTLRFYFTDVDDKVVLTSNSSLANYSNLVVNGGTLDISALSNASAFEGVTNVVVGSGLTLTGSQMANIQEVIATSGDAKLNIVIRNTQDRDIAESVLNELTVKDTGSGAKLAVTVTATESAASVTLSGKLKAANDAGTGGADQTSGESDVESPLPETKPTAPEQAEPEKPEETEEGTVQAGFIATGEITVAVDVEATETATVASLDATGVAESETVTLTVNDGTDDVVITFTADGATPPAWTASGLTGFLVGGSATLEGTDIENLTATVTGPAGVSFTITEFDAATNGDAVTAQTLTAASISNDDETFASGTVTFDLVAGNWEDTAPTGEALEGYVFQLTADGNEVFEFTVEADTGSATQASELTMEIVAEALRTETVTGFSLSGSGTEIIVTNADVSEASIVEIELVGYSADDWAAL